MIIKIIHEQQQETKQLNSGIQHEQVVPLPDNTQMMYEVFQKNCFFFTFCSFFYI